MDQSEIIPNLGAAEFHWHFVQGISALDRELYIPGIASLLNGVEASIRVTVNQLKGKNILELENLGPVLRNPLLCHAGKLGLPVEILAFPHERDFHKSIKC